MNFFKNVDEMSDEDILSELEAFTGERIRDDTDIEEVFSTLDNIDVSSEEYINSSSDLLDAINGLYDEQAEEAIINEVSNEEDMIDTITDASGYGDSKELAALDEEDEFVSVYDAESDTLEPAEEYVDDATAIDDDLSEDVEEKHEEVAEENHEEFEMEPVSSPNTSVGFERFDSEKEVTVITRGTTINGDISSECSLEVMGVIEGDVECQGRLSISGTVNGNIRASEIYVNTPVKLMGDLSIAGCVKISEESKIIGKIVASSAFIAGAVKGDIEVTGPVVIDSSAVVIGDISAGSLQFNNGAVIKGICTIGSESGLDSLFD